MNRASVLVNLFGEEGVVAVKLRHLLVFKDIPAQFAIDRGRRAAHPFRDFRGRHLGFTPFRDLPAFLESQVQGSNGPFTSSMQASGFIKNLYFVCEAAREGSSLVATGGSIAVS